MSYYGARRHSRQLRIGLMMIACHFRWYYLPPTLLLAFFESSSSLFERHRETCRIMGSLHTRISHAHAAIHQLKAAIRGYSRWYTKKQHTHHPAYRSASLLRTMLRFDASPRSSAEIDFVSVPRYRLWCNAHHACLCTRARRWLSSFELPTLAYLQVWYH